MFERGDVKLYEWVPVRVRIHALVGEADLREIDGLFPQSRTDVTVTYSEVDRICHGRHKEYDVSQMVDIYHGEGIEKWHRYGELLRGLFADQTAWTRDRSHPRKLTEGSGLNSTAMAVEATRLATT